jgi:hypothetical protein
VEWLAVAVRAVIGVLFQEKILVVERLRNLLQP